MSLQSEYWIIQLLKLLEYFLNGLDKYTSISLHHYFFGFIYLLGLTTVQGSYYLTNWCWKSKRHQIERQISLIVFLPNQIMVLTLQTWDFSWTKQYGGRQFRSLVISVPCMMSRRLVLVGVIVYLAYIWTPSLFDWKCSSVLCFFGVLHLCYIDCINTNCIFMTEQPVRHLFCFKYALKKKDSSAQ